MDDPKLVAASAIALAVTLFAIFSMRPVARRLGLVDKPDARKRHRGRVPLIGGLCFFLGTLVGLSYLGYLDRFVMNLMAGSVLIVAVGVVDDIAHLSVRTRLMVEACIVGWIIATSGVYIDYLGQLTATHELRLGLLGIPVTIVAIIGLVNAFNMLDGIDGLAAAVAMASIAAILLYAGAGLPAPGALLLLQLLFAALVPYIFVNLGWPDGRKIFMGDAGSKLIGFLLAWSLIFLSDQRVGRLAPVDVLWCVALPVMDTLAVMYRRFRLGRSPFKSDRQHLHHLLVDAGYSPHWTLAVIVGVCGFLALVGYVLRDAHDVLGAMAFLGTLVAYVAWAPRSLARLHELFPRQLSAEEDPLPVAEAAGFAANRRWGEGRSEAVETVDRHGAAGASSSMAGCEPPVPVKALCMLTASPDAIKIGPIAQRISHDERFDSTVCITAVPDYEAEQVLHLFDIRPDLVLDAPVSGVDPSAITQASLGEMKRVLGEIRPDVVLVPEGGSTTLATMLAAYHQDIPVVCIGTDSAAVGTASSSRADANRRIVRALASLHVMPDGDGDRDRHRTIEGVPADRVLVTGNTSVDTLHAALERLQQDAVLKRRLAQRFSFLRAGSPLLLLAARGPAAGASEAVASALRDIAVEHPELDIVYPADPERTPVNGSRGMAEACRNMHQIGPMDYLAWVYLLDMAYLILADEDTRMEAAALGKPVLLIPGRDVPDADIAAAPNAAKAGGRLEIVARISSLLDGSTAYDAMRQDSGQRGGGDSYGPMLEALANLRPTATAHPASLPVLERHLDPGMQGVREAL